MQSRISKLWRKKVWRENSEIHRGCMQLSYDTLSPIYNLSSPPHWKMSPRNKHYHEKSYGSHVAPASASDPAGFFCLTLKATNWLLLAEKKSREQTAEFSVQEKCIPHSPHYYTNDRDLVSCIPICPDHKLNTQCRITFPTSLYILILRLFRAHGTIIT